MLATDLWGSLRFPSRGGGLEALDHSDQLMPVPGRLTVLLDQSTLNHDEKPRADAQVFQIVGDEEHRRATITCGGDHVKERLLGGYINADCRRHRNKYSWMLCERSTDDDLLLIPSTQLHDLLIEAAGDYTQLFYQAGCYSVTSGA